jgi:hypothetical protein
MTLVFRQEREDASADTQRLPRLGRDRRNPTMSRNNAVVTRVEPDLARMIGEYRLGVPRRQTD